MLTYTCLKALEETVRKKFSLGVAQIEFYSSCGNLCGDVLTKIDEDVWELVAPCIGSITVIKTTPSTTEPVAGQFRLSQHLYGGKRWISCKQNCGPIPRKMPRNLISLSSRKSKLHHCHLAKTAAVQMATSEGPVTLTSIWSAYFHQP